MIKIYSGESVILFSAFFFKFKFSIELSVWLCIAGC